MHYLKFIVSGLLFGIIMAKSEAISWYRIQEMFHFQAIHMYGIIGLAVLLGMALLQIVKRYRLKDMYGEAIKVKEKGPGFWRYILGGIVFGMGWALTGACPGPIFVLAGQGYSPFIVVIASALLGTFVYGAVRDHLPH